MGICNPAVPIATSMVGGRGAGLHTAPHCDRSTPGTHRSLRPGTSAPAASRSQRAESSWGDAMAFGHYPAPATRSHANRTNADRVP